MSAPVVTVPAGATVHDAWARLVSSGLRHLVVTCEGRAVGLVSDRCVLAQWPLGPVAIRNRTVADLLPPRAHVVRPQADVADAAAAMVADGTDAVVVVDAEGTVVGVLTAGDITAAVARSASSATATPA